MLNKFLKPLLVAVMLASGWHAAEAADLIVSAAASLTNAFTELGKAYERKYPNAHVVLNFAGSGTLLQQISRGAPVDVFASADEETMDLAQNRQLIVAASRVDFAHNALVLIAPSDSRLRISKLAELRSDDVDRIAVSNPASVPVGRYTRQVLKEAGLWDVLGPKYINTQHVRQSLDYVARGEVDVGFVYATDARVMPQEVRVLMNVPTAIPIAYPIALVADSRKAVEASRFIEFVRSARGQSILLRYGFGAP
jgi:molybdate transport system substrate-binding protein